jgi:SEC-C motif-containing protein
MRSRYSAYALRDVEYLWRTLHPDHDDRGKSFEAFAAGMRAHFASKPVYQRLEIRGESGPDEEGIATVTFHATIRHRGRDASFGERSLFARDAAGWRYLTGVVG